MRRAVECVLVSALCAFAPLAHAAEAVVNLLTGRTNSPYHPLGLALGDALGKAMPSLKASVQATKGSVENLELLEAGRADFAFTLGDSLSDAWMGSEDAGFKSPLRNLRAIATLYPNYVHIIARADSGTRTLLDLKRKKVSVGAPRTGIERNARTIFAAAGFTYRQLGKVEYLPFGESVELMKDRQLDATLQSTALGASTLRDLAASVAIVFVDIPPDVLRKIHDPAYLPATIPANTYSGQTKAIHTVSVQNFLVTHEGVDDDTVYGVTKALWNALDDLAAAHPAGKSISIDNALTGMVIPLHPGAERFYREAGVLK